MKTVARMVLLLCLVWQARASGTDDPALFGTSAETVTPVVELYTSEGCSSCPPADRFLARIGNMSGNALRLVPLAFHVDYWNRLGWPDPYSRAQFTERQRMVARRNAQRSIYTPELVVDGREVRNGGQVFDWVTESNREQARVHITFHVNQPQQESLTADLAIRNELDGTAAADGYVAIYENGIVRHIGGGENAGKTLNHEYVVRYWSSPFPVPARERTMRTVSLPLEQGWERRNLGMAIIVVDPQSGVTLQSVNASLEPVFSDPPGAS